MRVKFPEISLSGEGLTATAFDPASKRNFARDGDTWIDVKTGEVVCPDKKVPGSGWGGFLFWCLREKFPEISLSGEGLTATAFDPASKRNFARDGDTWIDVKTGEIICPKQKPSTAQQPQTIPEIGSVPPVNLSPFASGILAVHNATRAEFGAPPLKWDAAAADRAGAWAGELARIGRLEHSPREGRGTERENVGRGPLGYSAVRITNLWVDERVDFVPGTFPNICRSGAGCEGVLHFTQMIWPTTTSVGCAQAIGRGQLWIVCRYNPGGNKDGKAVGIPVPVAPDHAPQIGPEYGENETVVQQSGR